LIAALDSGVFKLTEPAPIKLRHGGVRPGAGRKKKGAAAPSAVAGVDLRVALAAPAPSEVEPVASVHAQTALEALYKELIGGQSEAARVAAANEILDRGWGKPTVESGGDLTLPFFGTAPARQLPSEIRAACRKLTQLAVEALVKIATNGVSESARVSAARSLLNRGLGAVAPARVPEDMGLRQLGKKAEQERAAQNPDTESPMGQLMARRAATFAGKPH
jgi:hypothetical protein